MFRKIIFLLVYSSVVFAQTSKEEYPRAEERKKAMELVADVKARSGELGISDWDRRSEKEKAFLDHYRKEVFSRTVEMVRLNSVSGILHVSVDRALYNDEAEKQAWIEEMNAAEIEANRIQASNDFKAALKRSAELAEGLTGELAQNARDAYAIDQLSGFNEELMPLVEKQTTLNTAISLKSNESKVTGHDLGAYQKEIEDVEKLFRAGKLNFTEATHRIDAIWSKGFHAKGEDVAQTANDELNELARLRTQLARAKGFNSWADYKLATETYNYETGYATADERIEVLTRILQETLPAHLRYRDWVTAQHPEIPAKEIDNRNAYLLAPETDTMMADYFPVEKVNEFWRQTMLESGFTPESLQHINLDSFPRDKKQTHAYMANVVSAQPRNISLKPGTLDFDLSGSNGDWLPAMIYIVQNARIDGMDAYSTVFHEGGHGQDYVHRRGVFREDTAYGYTETASMTMERFFADREFLLARGRTREGQGIPEGVVDAYIKNDAMVDALGSRGQVFNALFDILIWKEAYTSSSTPFVDRVMQIYDDLQTKYFPGPRTFPKGTRPGSRMFATSHFYSGEVRYFGYIVADIAAQMTADYLWDHFQKTTGRRTFLNQSQIAEILIKGQYQFGYREKFPDATEKLTGKEFDLSVLIDAINNAVPPLKPQDGGKAKSDCEKLLT